MAYPLTSFETCPASAAGVAQSSCDITQLVKSTAVIGSSCCGVVAAKHLCVKVGCEFGWKEQIRLKILSNGDWRVPTVDWVLLGSCESNKG